MAINDQTLYTDVWTTIRNIVVASSPYISNSVTNATTVASVYASFNDTTPTRPQIIINPIEKSESEYKFGSISGKKSINVIIDCYGTKSVFADQLIQAVDYALASSIPEGIELIGTVSNSPFETLNGTNKLFGQSMTFTYIRE